MMKFQKLKLRKVKEVEHISKFKNNMQVFIFLTVIFWQLQNS